MAKKKTDEKPDETPKPDADQGGEDQGRPDNMSNAEAVRRALKAGHTSPKDGVAWIKEEFGIDVKPGSFSVEKSKQSGTAGTGVRRGSRNQGNGEPSTADLLKVAEWLNQGKDPALKRTMIAEIVRFASEIDGLDKLESCVATLVALDKLAGK